MIFKVVRGLPSLLLLACLAGQAQAEVQYYSTRSILKTFFPDSDRVTYVKYAPTKSERSALEKRLGYKLPKTSYVFYIAKTGDQVDGYAFIDDQMGQHLPITFAVKLSPQGVVQRQEVTAYREPRGDEIRDRRFRDQFKGKTVQDELRPDHDIDSISGATISSRAITVGVKRSLVLFDAADLAIDESPVSMRTPGTE